MPGLRGNIIKYLTDKVSIAPLAVFRVLFGGIMFISILRFMLKGWISDLYIVPQFFFTYYGFEWIQPFGETGMYVVFALMAISALGIMTGSLYRFSTTLFFLLFTYVELIDKANYLNHYYFVSIASFLMILLPANRYFSLDTWSGRIRVWKQTPRWTTAILKLQLGLVYFYAGVAKLNPEWLFEAMPLKIWLPAHTHLPVIGPLFDHILTAYAFSWAGALYDLSIPFLLLNKKTRIWAYGAVIIFHLLTRILFPIGMFPYIMILCTLIFFSEGFHERLINGAKTILGRMLPSRPDHAHESPCYRPVWQKMIFTGLAIHLILQLIIPWRFVLYPGNLFWTEEGYRFSWRVMLMEKAGMVVYHVSDPVTGRSEEVHPAEYLTKNQEKMMATQPDMILQFAHFIEEQYRNRGMADPEIKVESYVSLNGQGSRPFINPAVDLTMKKPGLGHKDWIIPYEQKEYWNGM